MLRHIVTAAQSESVEDAELLGRYLEGDPTGFELVVWRHGGMVIGECRRMLDEHEAEDAFQAVFLALARRAGHLSKRPGSVGGWLRTVTRRVVLKANKQHIARNGRER